MADHDKHRLFHKLRGSRCLDDKLAEAIAYLLSDSRTEGDIGTAYPDLPSADLEAMRADEVFQRRVAYLKNRSTRAKKKPKSYEDYKGYSLRKLHSLAETAQDEKVQAMSAEKLGNLAHRFMEVAPPEQTNTLGPGSLAELGRAFKESDE